MTAPDPEPKAHPLDQPIARLVAFGVVLLVIAALAWIHRDDLFPPTEQAAAPTSDPVARCVAERAEGIEAMLADGTIDAEQAALFRQRAEAFCEDQVGRGGGPPPPPGN